MPGKARRCVNAVPGEDLAAVQLLHHHNKSSSAHTSASPVSIVLGSTHRRGLFELDRHMRARGSQRGTQFPGVDHGLRRATGQIEADRNRLRAQEVGNAALVR
jgi:hypothetical protein